MHISMYVCIYIYTHTHIYLLDAHLGNQSCLVISVLVIYEPFGAELFCFNYHRLMSIGLKRT